MERYARQEAFYGVGEAGQRRLLESRVTVIGLGALGSASANLLARAGIGFLRIVDRDFVEYSNLQRQTLYREIDAEEAAPKAAAAAEILGGINGEIEIEPVIVDVNGGNIGALIEDVDLVIDATDNVEVRRLIGEACHALKKPWIYGGALASSGMTMNILPEEGAPCYGCLFDGQEAGGETCATAGVLGTLTSIVASIQCTEALKILVGSPEVRRTLLAFDIWTGDFDEMEVEKRPDCPICGREEYVYYGKGAGMQSEGLCGRDAVQIVPESPRRIDFDDFALRWQKCGAVEKKKFTIDLDLGDLSIKLFADGRAIIRGTTDTARARSVYTEYIGE